MIVVATIMYLATATIGVLRFGVAMSELLSMLLWSHTMSAIAQAWGHTVVAIAAEGGDSVLYVLLGMLGCVLLTIVLERK